jgi:DNA-binding MarR family transcriptional regulator
VAELTRKGRVFWQVLMELFRLRAAMLESAEHEAEAAGLTTARWQVLGIIENTPATVAHVARTLGLTRQAVQETADAMEREGLVAFGKNPDHKRARLMSPTPKARKALDYLRPRQVLFANLMGGPHPLEALRATLDVLEKSRLTIESRNRSTE